MKNKLKLNIYWILYNEISLTAISWPSVDLYGSDIDNKVYCVRIVKCKEI